MNTNVFDHSECEIPSIVVYGHPPLWWLHPEVFLSQISALLGAGTALGQALQYNVVNTDICLILSEEQHGSQNA